MPARTPNNIPANKFSLPFTILAIQTDDLSSRQAESYTVVLLRHDEKPAVRTGLDLDAIGSLAATDASGSLLAALDRKTIDRASLADRGRHRRRGAGRAPARPDPAARTEGLRTRNVERCFDLEPLETVAEAAETGNGAGGASPADSGNDGALQTAVLCRALLDLLASQDPDTMEMLIRLAEGTGTGLERLLARMSARTAGRGDAASRVDRSGRSGERPSISPIPCSVRPRSATARATRPKRTVISIRWTRRIWPACLRPAGCSKAAWKVTSNGRSRYPWSAASPARSTMARCCWWKRVRARGNRFPT